MLVNQHRLAALLRRRIVPDLEAPARCSRPAERFCVTQFKDLGLAEPILKALAAEGYSIPTPIQMQTIPLVLEGRDVVGLAQTGTGKTAAFALPIIHRLAANRRHAGQRACRVLVLSPTRELASQIADSFRAYGRFMGLSTAVVFGGASMGKQKGMLMRGVDVLVATPGRLLDHVQQRSLRLDAVETLVLDEADHMLDMGFIHDLKRITTLLPRERQSLFFSATMPPPIAELSTHFLRGDASRVAVQPPATTAERVEQAVIHVMGGQKQDLLHDLLRDPAIARALVFTRTKHGADRVVSKLAEAGFAAEAIHGNKSQGQRERALEAFKKGRARLLVATEIAARGIDVDNVSHVINFDLPNVPDQYVHRIGRTARAGQTGMAISFCAPDERDYLRDIEKLTRQAVPVVRHALSTDAPAERPKKPQQQQRRGPPRGQGKPGGHKRGEAPRHENRRDEHKRVAQHRSEGHPRGEGQYRGEGPRSERPNRNDGQQRSDGQHRGERQDRKSNAVWSNQPRPQGQRARGRGKPQG